MPTRESDASRRQGRCQTERRGSWSTRSPLEASDRAGTLPTSTRGPKVPGRHPCRRRCGRHVGFGGARRSRVEAMPINLRSSRWSLIPPLDGRASPCAAGAWPVALRRQSSFQPCRNLASSKHCAPDLAIWFSPVLPPRRPAVAQATSHSPCGESREDPLLPRSRSSRTSAWWTARQRMNPSTITCNGVPRFVRRTMWFCGELAHHDFASRGMTKGNDGLGLPSRSQRLPSNFSGPSPCIQRCGPSPCAPPLQAARSGRTPWSTTPR